MSSLAVPSEINVKKQSRLLQLVYDDGQMFEYSFEFLRVHSPSAEVRGHGPSDAVLQVGKENVQIESIEPVGNYAIKLIFDDGHNTGLYSWQYLRELGENMQSYWSKYLTALNEAGHQREQND